MDIVEVLYVKGIIRNTAYPVTISHEVYRYNLGDPLERLTGSKPWPHSKFFIATVEVKNSGWSCAWLSYRKPTSTELNSIAAGRNIFKEREAKQWKQKQSAAVADIIAERIENVRSNHEKA